MNLVYYDIYIYMCVSCYSLDLIIGPKKTVLVFFQQKNFSFHLWFGGFQVKTSDGKSSLSVPCPLDLRTHRFALSNLARDRFFWGGVGLGVVGPESLLVVFLSASARCVFFSLLGGWRRGWTPPWEYNGWLQGDRFLLVWFLVGEMKSKKHIT